MIFEQINNIITEYFYYIFIALLFAYVIQTRRCKDRGKVMPLFFLALLFFTIMVVTIVTKTHNLPLYFPSVFALLLMVSSFTIYRKRFFPYRFTCNKCGKKLKSKEIFLDTDYLCGDCKDEEE
jgi:uncharacterized membrane protein YhaH (DUF805 family)